MQYESKKENIKCRIAAAAGRITKGLPIH
jgi:hypothetical protein